MSTTYISHTQCTQHEMGEGHPEAPERIAAINSALSAAGYIEKMDCINAPLAAIQQVKRAHDHAYVEHIFAHSPSQGYVALDPDTSINPYSLDAALRASGAVIEAVERVMNRRTNNAFCNVRPPGHHAEFDKAMGFCIFNSIAVGAAHLLEQHALERIAILDFDVHHGNGTEHIFKNDPRVLICQTFQSPLYPHTGLSEHTELCHEHVINAPLPSGADGEDFKRVVNKYWLPKITAFKPQFILISAGFDAHVDDPLAQLHFVEEDFFWITQEIMRLADQYCDGRIVSSLEGGYHLNALGKSVEAHIRALLRL